MNGEVNFTPFIDELLEKRKGVQGDDEIIMIPCTKPEIAQAIYLKWLRRFGFKENENTIVETQENRILIALLEAKKGMRNFVGPIEATINLYDYNCNEKRIEYSTYKVKGKSKFDLIAGDFTHLEYYPIRSRVENKALFSGPLRKMIESLSEVG